MNRKVYFTVFVTLVALLTVGGLYLRYRSVAAARALRPGSGQAANCDTPAPPPKPATPPPKLPDFQIEAGCGTGDTGAERGNGAGGKRDAKGARASPRVEKK
jgi:hypothetical protein